MTNENKNRQEQSEVLETHVKRPLSAILLACAIYAVTGIVFGVWFGSALQKAGFIKSDSVNVTIEEVGAETLNNQPIIDR